MKNLTKQYLKQYQANLLVTIQNTSYVTYMPYLLDSVNASVEGNTGNTTYQTFTRINLLQNYLNYGWHLILNKINLQDKTINSILDFLVNNFPVFYKQIALEMIDI